MADQSPWWSLVTLGPAGFDAYGRLRFLPDPETPGQREGDVDWERPPYDGDQWPGLLAALAIQTSTPEDCYVCLWEGWPFEPRPSTRPTVGLVGAVGALDRRSVVRSYYLFGGPLADFSEWRATDAQGFEPALVWPADRAWCVANDVDPH